MAPGESGARLAPRALLVVLLTAVVLLAAVPLAMAATQLVGWQDRRNVPVVLVVAIFVLVCAASFHGLLRRIGGAFAPVVAHLGAAASAAVFVFNARRAIAYELSYGHSSALDSLEVEVYAPWAAFIALCGGLVAWLALRTRKSASIARGSRIAAFMVLAVGTIAVVFGATRAAKLPAVDHYVASLPVVGTLPEVEGLDEDLATVWWPAHDVELGGVFTRRRCIRGLGCSIQIVMRQEDLSESRAVGHEWYLPGVMKEIVLRRDDRRGLLVLETSLPWRMWLDGRTAEWARVLPDASTIGPPWRWVAGGVVGLLIAAGALFHRPAAVRRAKLVAHARAGQSDGTRVTFEDGTPPFDLRSTNAKPTQGPVLVVPDERPKAVSFRETGAIGAAQVHAGTLEDHVEASHAASAARATFAIAAVALACAPLLAG